MTHFKSLVSPDAAVNSYVVGVTEHMLMIADPGLRCGALFEEIQNLTRMLKAAESWRRRALARFRAGEPREPYPNKLFPPQIVEVRQRMSWLLADAAERNRALHAVPRDTAPSEDAARAARLEHNLRLARAH